MKKLLLLATLLSPALAQAQVTLTAAQAPAVNSVIIYNDCNVPSPAFTYGTSGTMNVWDFASLTSFPGAEDTTYVVSPSDVPLASAFPSATHCLYDDGGANNIQVIQVNSSGSTTLGVITDPIGTMVPIALQPPVNTMPFPFTYPNSMNVTTQMELSATGAQAGQPVDSIRLRSTTNVLADVIASGTMVIQSGSLPAILRRQINTKTDSIFIKASFTGGQWILSGAPTITIDSAFYWYSNQSILPYAHALYDDTGLHDVNYYKETLTGIQTNAKALAFDLYPNPSSDIIRFKGLINGVNYSVSVKNLTGQTILEGTTNMNQFNVSFLQPGIYLLQLADANGNSFTKKFVKE